MPGNHSWKEDCQYFYITVLFFILVVMVTMSMVIIADHYKGLVQQYEANGTCDTVYYWQPVNVGENDVSQNTVHEDVPFRAIAFS